MTTTGYLDGLANLGGRTAAVVGGGGGIGRAVSMALAKAGVELAILDRDAEALEATCAEIRALDGRVVSRVADATVTAELGGFYDQVEREYDGLDILVNVVGGSRQRLFMDCSPSDWQRDIQLNYGYALESMHRGVQLMQRRGRGGAIVNFTTVEAHRGAASYAVYAGAKAGLTNFSRALAVELGPLGIRVNLLASDTTPSAGNVNARSPEIQALSATASDEQRAKGRAFYVPMGRPPDPEDLATSVLFLVSDLAAFITGTTLHVDGGTFAACGFLNWPHTGYGPAANGPALMALFPDDGA